MDLPSTRLGWIVFSLVIVNMALQPLQGNAAFGATATQVIGYVITFSMGLTEYLRRYLDGPGGRK